MENLNPTRCPICLEPNVCAMEMAKATGNIAEGCWCVDAVFSPAAMEQVPDSAKGKVCICARCAAGT